MQKYKSNSLEIILSPFEQHILYYLYNTPSVTVKEIAKNFNCKFSQIYRALKNIRGFLIKKKNKFNVFIYTLNFNGIFYMLAITGVMNEAKK